MKEDLLKIGYFTCYVLCLESAFFYSQTPYNPTFSPSVWMIFDLFVISAVIILIGVYYYNTIKTGRIIINNVEARE